MENSKSEPVKLEMWSKILGVIVPTLIILINSIEIHILRKSANKPFYEKILLSLSINDLICGLVSSVTVPYLSLVKNEFYILLHWNAWGTALCYITLSSLVHLIIISVDTLWAVGAPLNHRKNATTKKLLIAVVSCWTIPIIFVVAFISFVLFEGMQPAEAYKFGTGTMCGVVAKVVLIADVMLLICYCAIIWVIRTKTIPSKQKKSMNTLFLCIGIVSVFVAFSTPFVVVFITNWNSPHWLQKFAVILFPFNHISNSIVYLMHKHHSKKSSIASRDSKEQKLQRRSDQDQILLVTTD